MYLQRKLSQWREEQARREGLESFKVLSKATLDAIVVALPKTKEELLQVKGIKEKKYQKYGQAILALVAEEIASDDGDEEKLQDSILNSDTLHEPLSISQFLDGINTELSGMAARIQGEVTSVDERERVVYFTLKDKVDGSTLACLIFRYAYQVSGVALAIGDEVIVEGAPEIYKPNGRLSFKVGTIEVAGEGALKKAYDELFLKLQTEGMFALDQKQELPEYIERIALITSADGAAIDDFKKNLGNCGFKIDFYPTAVEGKKAVFEILKAIQYFGVRAIEFDVLVIIRGGGSLESLQAFNNETLVREIASFPIPTLLGVGHEKDITLSALAADSMVSTPTATAQTISAPWLEARQRVSYLRRNLPQMFEQQLQKQEQLFERAGRLLIQFLQDIRQVVGSCEQSFWYQVHRFGDMLKYKNKALLEAKSQILEGFGYMQKRYEQYLARIEEALKLYDPMRALKLGYGLIRKGVKLIKNTAAIHEGDILTIQLAQGSIETEVKKVI